MGSSQSETGITEPVRPPRALATARRFAPLRGFSCGRGGAAWETVVNRTARGLYLGRENRPLTTIVLEDGSGRLIGFCCVGRDELPLRAGRHRGTAWSVLVIGTDRRHRGQRLQDGSSPGDVLLRAALERIAEERGGRDPLVWAHIAPENEPSRALFARHGFDELPATAVVGGDIVWVRPQRRRLAAMVPRPIGARGRTIRRIAAGEAP
ncbi:MAG TPA: GNAT family N-acetyltransferase [Solirubrobacteraceae bacterium]|jgi:ribosomal protein S18 acetylase RimI-like enzyme|nr:GNAT family N-acetyltransferase [Solirubrobacteraceae bacterium]